MNDSENLRKGKYKVIYRKATGKTPEVGSLSAVKRGDIVAFYDGGHRTAVIAKVMGSKWLRHILTEPIVYDGKALTKPRTLEKKDIDEILRLDNQSDPDLQSPDV